MTAAARSVFAEPLATVKAALTNYWANHEELNSTLGGEALAALDLIEQRAADMEKALREIQHWDCLNPPDPNLCADHPWLKRLVDAALSAREEAQT